MSGYIVTITKVERRSKDFRIEAASQKQAREVANELIKVHGGEDWKVTAVKSFEIEARQAND